MAKTQEELNAIKEEIEALNEKLAELTEEELDQVTGGYGWLDVGSPEDLISGNFRPVIPIKD